MQSKPSFKKDVLPWFYALYFGRNQSSNLRVTEICEELISAIENRLIYAYRSTGLKHNELLIECTDRGKKLLDGHIASRISINPEIGFDDESLKVYHANANKISIDEIQIMVKNNNMLDMLLEDLL